MPAPARRRPALHRCDVATAWFATGRYHRADGSGPRAVAAAATRVAGNDDQGRLALCKYILCPPLANDRLKILDDNVVGLEFKKPWSDGTSSVELAPLALIARLAALVPPPRRHLTGYLGVLSSHSSLRSQCVPAPVPETTPEQEDKSPRTLPLSHYISWSEFFRRTFESRMAELRCGRAAGIESEGTSV